MGKFPNERIVSRLQPNVTHVNRVRKEITVAAPVWETSSRQRAASCGWHGKQSALTVRGKGNACLQIVAGEIRKIFEDLIFGHVGSQIFQHLIDGNSQAANARFSTALVWVNGDVILVIHVLRLGRQ